MKRSTKVLSLAIAIVLILGGIAGAIFAIIADKTQLSAPTDSAENAVVIHEDVEYLYDANGDLKTEVYYKDNVYDGRKDYYNADGDEYVTVFDKDGNEIFSSKAEYNAAGCLSTMISYENHTLKEEVEYVYGDDLRTLQKKTVKTYKGEDEYAEKTYYNEEGKKARVCKYLNGELTEEIVYDEAESTDGQQG